MGCSLKSAAFAVSETREIDHEREQIHDIFGRIISPHGLEPGQRMRVSTAARSCHDMCKGALPEAHCATWQCSIRHSQQLRVAISLHLRVDGVAHRMGCHRSSEHPAKQVGSTGFNQS